jgi:hypothetical protein
MEIINWIKETPEIFFVGSYGSYDQDQTINFHTRKAYEEIIFDSHISPLVDYWNTGECRLLELKMMPDISERPMWREIYQNYSPDVDNYLPTSEQIELVLKNRIKEILSGEIFQISFTFSDDQYYALTTGVVKP